MNDGLAAAFISRGILRKGTMIEVQNHSAGKTAKIRDLAKHVVIGAHSVDNEIVFWTICDADANCRIKSTQIVSIDGMLVDRLAASHRLNEFGVEKPRKGRRRQPGPIKPAGKN